MKFVIEPNQVYFLFKKSFNISICKKVDIRGKDPYEFMI
jgi:hypothetical protein